MDRFVPEIIALRARRAAPVLSSREAELLIEVGRGLPDELRQVCARLVESRDAGTLTPAEHEELIRLSDAVEAFQARRLELLVGLAQLRGITLDVLLKELGISPLPDV